jgi:tape measure domain-containing protein
VATTLRFDIVARDFASVAFDRLGRKTGLLGRTFGNFGAVAAVALKSSTLAAATFGAVAAKTGLQTAAGLESAAVSFESLSGSASKANKLLEDLKEFTVKTPFEIQGLVATSKRLLGVGIAAEDVIPTLRILGDTAAAFGVTGEQFERVLFAITQSLAKGKFQAEEFNQISEAGIPITKILGRALGKTSGEILQLAREGELAADVVFPKLLDQLQQDYTGSMQKQVNTLNGLWSNLMDAFKLGSADAIEPLIPLLKDALPGAAAATRSGLRQAGEGLADLIQFIRPLLPAIDQVRMRLIDMVPVGTITSSLGEAAKAVRDFLIGLSGTNIPGTEDMMLHIFDPSAAQQAGANLRDLLSGGIGDAISDIDWNNVGRMLGDGLGQAFEFATSSIGGLASSIVDAVAGLDWFQIGKDAGGNTLDFALGFLQGLSDTLLSVSWWQENFWNVVATVAAIVPIGRFAGLLSKAVAKIPILKAFDPLLRGLSGLGGLVEKALGPVTKAVVAALGFLARNILNGIGRAFGVVGLGEKVRRFLSVIPTAIQVVAVDVFAKGRAMITGLGSAISGAAGVVARAIGTVIGVILKPFAKAAGWLVKAGSSVISGLLRGAQRAASPVFRWFAAIRGRITRLFARASSWLLNAGRAVIASLQRGAQSRLGAVLRFFRGLAGRIRGWVGNLGSLLYNAGRQIINSLISGINSRVSALRGRAAAIASSIKRFFGGSLPEEGPLKGNTMEMAGAELLQNLAKGMRRGATGLNIGAIAGTAVSGLSGGLASPQSFGGAGVRGPARVVLDIRGGDDDMVRLIRKWTRTKNLNQTGRNLNAVSV